MERLRKDRDISTHQAAGDNHFQESYQRSKVDPLAGLTWKVGDTTLVRAACRRWARPVSIDTMAPVAVAGIPLDDQLVFAGGVLEQCRAQVEWSNAADTFITAYAERSRVHNLVSPLDGVQNANTDVTNLDRLRNRAIRPVPKPDELEDTPVYGQGEATRGTLAFDRIVTTNVAFRAYYTYTDSENTDPSFAGKEIPYLPRHQVNLGATWSPGWHAFVTAQAVYRTRRFTDEANLLPLPSSWDAYLDVFIESPDKHWSVEAFGSNLLKKEASDVFGVIVSYRF
jgi:outer membrane receptor protein involved in Fe transport